jgi:hypothetical protein
VQSITRSHAESRSILWPSITRPLRLGPCPGGPPADWLVCACARHGGRRRRTAAAGPGGHQPAAGVARAALPRPATGLRCCTRQQRRRMCVDSRSGHACPAQMLRADGEGKLKGTPHMHGGGRTRVRSPGRPVHASYAASHPVGPGH